MCVCVCVSGRITDYFSGYDFVCLFAPFLLSRPHEKITTNEGLLVVSRGQTELFPLACECRSPISQVPAPHKKNIKL